MECPLCDSKQFKKHRTAVNGSYEYRCDTCGNIFRDSTDNAFCQPQINFLRFKQKNLVQPKAIDHQEQEINLEQLAPEKANIFEIPNKAINRRIIEVLSSRLFGNITQAKQMIFLATLFFGLGLILTFIVPNIIPYFHRMDVQTFHAWADCFAQTGRDIYLACYYNNSPTPGLIAAYPSIGMLASGGVIYLIKYLMALTDWEQISNVFRSYLFLFDLFNLFLFVTIARMMQFRKPLLIGLMLFLIPSNLVGGAMWGQIDNISLTFCLITSIALVKSWAIEQKNYARSQQKAIAWLLLAAVCLPIFILLKQLSIFSAPYFVVIFAVTAIKFWQNWQRKGLIWIGSALGIFVATFYSLDHILSISDKFFGSSYYYLFAGGDIDTRYIISANGFNLWMFLGRDPSSSSRIPFSLLWDKGFVLNMSPYDLGISLYLVWSLFLFGTTVMLAKKLLEESQINPSKFHPKLMTILFFYHGLSQLGFNVLLTGTHERYLYMGYPFLLLAGACFFTQQLVFSWRLISLCFLSAFVYGCFVFSVIGPLPGLFFAFSRHEFLATLHLFLLVLLAGAWLQTYQMFRKPLESI
jgi:hypothetical protein